jgi:hypothetical protein
MTACDAAAEDQGEFVGLIDGAIGIEEPLLKGIDGGARTKDQIVAILHLCKKHPVLNAGMFHLLGGEGVKRASHFWAQRIRSSAVRESAIFCKA